MKAVQVNYSTLHWINPPIQKTYKGIGETGNVLREVIGEMMVLLHQLD